MCRVELYLKVRRAVMVEGRQERLALWAMVSSSNDHYCACTLLASPTLIN